MLMFTFLLHYQKCREQPGSIRSNMLYLANKTALLFFFCKTSSRIFLSSNACYCTLIFPIETELGHIEGKISAQRQFYTSSFPSSSISLYCYFSLNSLSLESAMLIMLLQPSGGGARGGQKNEILIFIRSICLRSSSQSWKEQSAERR